MCCTVRDDRCWLDVDSDSDSDVYFLQLLVEAFRGVTPCEFRQKGQQICVLQLAMIVEFSPVEFPLLIL
jgi:hypothetical protein